MLVHMVKRLSIVLKLTLHCVSYCIYGTQYDINEEKISCDVFYSLKLDTTFFFFF